MPFEITRDIARERSMDVDQYGYEEYMNKHKETSGAGIAMGDQGGDDVEGYQHSHRVSIGLMATCLTRE